MTGFELLPVVALLGAAMLGAMLFFAGVVAPLVFRHLPPDMAGSFLRGLFPRYYDVLAVANGLAMLLAFGTWAGVVLAASAILFLVARFWLMPRINTARDAALRGDAVATRRFGRLHGASVAINVVQMFALLAVIFWIV